MLNWKAPASAKTLQWHNDRAYNGNVGVANDPQGMATIFAANLFTANDLKSVNGLYTVTANQNGIESAESNSVEFSGFGGASLNEATTSKIYYDAKAEKVILSQPADAVIYSATGVIVKESKGKTTIEVSDLPTGIYIVSNKQNQTLKFVK